MAQTLAINPCNHVLPSGGNGGKPTRKTDSEINSEQVSQETADGGGANDHTQENDE